MSATIRRFSAAILSAALTLGVIAGATSAPAAPAKITVSGSVALAAGETATDYGVRVSTDEGNTYVALDSAGNFSAAVEEGTYVRVRVCLNSYYTSGGTQVPICGSGIITTIGGIEPMYTHIVETYTGLQLAYVAAEQLKVTLAGYSALGTSPNPANYSANIDQIPCGSEDILGLSDSASFDSSWVATVPVVYPGVCYRLNVYGPDNGHWGIIDVDKAGTKALVHDLAASERNVSVTVAARDLVVSGSIAGLAADLTGWWVDVTEIQETADGNTYSSIWQADMLPSGTFEATVSSGLTSYILQVYDQDGNAVLTDLNGTKSRAQQLTSFTGLTLKAAEPEVVSGKVTGFKANTKATKYTLHYEDVLAQSNGTWKRGGVDASSVSLKSDGSFSFKIYSPDYYRIWVTGPDPYGSSTSADLATTLGSEKSMQHILGPGAHAGLELEIVSPAGALNDSEPVPAFTPVIEGSSTVGDELKVGEIPEGWKATYQWLLDGQPIAGATGATYTPTKEQLGKVISVTVTISKNGQLTGSATVAFPGTVTVNEAAEHVAAISGTPALTKTVKAAKIPAGWKAAYQWYRAGKAISKATKSSYKLVKADYGKAITYKVTLTRTGYATTVKTSAKVYGGQASKITAKLAASKIKASKKGQVKVTITVPAVKSLKLKSVTKPTGKIAVTYVKGKTTKTKTYTLAASKKGKVTLTLPKLAKGTYKVTVAYKGTTKIAPVSAKALTLKVS